MELKDDLFEEFAPDEKEREGEVPVAATGENQAPNGQEKGNEAPKYAFTEKSEPVKLPFPPEDYDKKGNLKKVRGRVLRKLIKNEIKHYLPFTLGFMGLLLLTGIFCGLGMREVLQSTPAAEGVFPEIVNVTALLLFIACCTGALIFATAYPIVRYEKNFFQSQGYLTFSIPASMEEQVLAKRIVAALCSYAMSIVLVLSVFLVVLCSGDMRWETPWKEGIFALSNEVYLKGGHAVAYMIESLLSAMVSGVTVPSVFAALACLLSKTSGKRKVGLIILLIFLGTTVVDAFSATFLTTDNIFPRTAVWAHISVWLSILLEGAVAVGCILFEVWYLKHKLDLK